MEHLKWLGVGSVDVEFYYDFIMAFLLSIFSFFLFMYQLFSDGN